MWVAKFLKWFADRMRTTVGQDEDGAGRALFLDCMERVTQFDGLARLLDGGDNVLEEVRKDAAGGSSSRTMSPLAGMSATNRYFLDRLPFELQSDL